jgi:hypothetical protein
MCRSKRQKAGPPGDALPTPGDAPAHGPQRRTAGMQGSKCHASENVSRIRTDDLGSHAGVFQQSFRMHENAGPGLKCFGLQIVHHNLLNAAILRSLWSMHRRRETAVRLAQENR